MSRFLSDLRELVDALDLAPRESRYFVAKQFFIGRYGGGPLPYVPTRDSDGASAVKEIISTGVSRRTAYRRLFGR
jgi:hypothetical protein